MAIKGYCCGVPHNMCNGSSKIATKSLTTMKVHGTPEEARRCLIRYYTSLGYTQVGNTMQNGVDPAIVLTRLSRMQPVRSGKEGRVMPKRDHLVY